MSHPDVSIVLPTYNGSDFLDMAIRSCILQTYSDWELIIVDDASTDRTPSIASRYARRDKRIRIIRHENNRRLPGALNTGFAAAEGRLLTWTSDDNCYRSHAIAEMVGFLDRHPEIDIVYADFTIFNDNSEPVAPGRVKSWRYLPVHNPVGACFLYRRIVMEVLGEYDEALFGAEDYDFWLRAYSSFTFKTIHKNLYLYRKHETSITDMHRDKVEIATERAVRKHIPMMAAQVGTVGIMAHLQLCNFALKRNDLNRAWRDFINAMRISLGGTLRQVPLKVLLYLVLGKKIAGALKGVARGH